MRISELAERVGVATSTVRYYERIGLLEGPARTASGYRNYDEEAAHRLVFLTRARRMGLSCDEITSILGISDGANCEQVRQRVRHLIDEKQAEIQQQIAELRRFSVQLSIVERAIDALPTLAACATDLSCCVPESQPRQVDLDLVPRPRRDRRT
jgi:MerR family copper efflux transcriptional regulator